MATAGSLKEPRIVVGLDVSRPDELTDQELAAFRDFYSGLKGEQLVGHEFLLALRPDVLKRYWNYVSLSQAETAISLNMPLSFIHYYAIFGWQDGMRQQLHATYTLGGRREHALDTIAIAALQAGPRGMQGVAEAIRSQLEEYTEPEGDPQWPEGWTQDKSALATGLDFSDPDLSSREANAVREWYGSALGEVPKHVDFLVDHAPQVLKAYRNRLENAISGDTPVALLAECLLQTSIYRGHPSGIREGVLLAKYVGISRAQVVDAVLRCTFYGGVDTLSLVQMAAGDVLAEMD